jgi:hypothetical protein
MNIINNQFKDYSTLSQQREFVDKLYQELTQKTYGAAISLPDAVHHKCILLMHVRILHYCGCYDITALARSLALHRTNTSAIIEDVLKKYPDEYLKELECAANRNSDYHRHCDFLQDMLCYVGILPITMSQLYSAIKQKCPPIVHPLKYY